MSDDVCFSLVSVSIFNVALLIIYSNKSFLAVIAAFTSEKKSISTSVRMTDQAQTSAMLRTERIPVVLDVCTKKTWIP
jgi:hypothetical protein